MKELLILAASFALALAASAETFDTIFRGGRVIDGSGNLWLTNYNAPGLNEVVGAASPVVTPMAANLRAPYSGPASRPLTSITGAVR